MKGNLDRKQSDSAGVLGNGAVRFSVSLSSVVLWVAYAWQVSSILTPDAAARVIYCAFSAEIFSRLVGSRWSFSASLASSQSVKRISSARPKQVRLGAKTIAVCGVFVIAAVQFPPEVLVNSPFSVFTVVALTAVLVLIRQFKSTKGNLARRASSVELAHFVRLTLLLVLTRFADQYWQVDGDMLLILQLFAALFCFAALAPFWTNARNSEGRGSISKPFENQPTSLGHSVHRFGDVVMVAWLLTPSDAFTYLSMRLAVQGLSVVVLSLLSAASPALTQVYRHDGFDQFRSAAARANLSVLLIGGAVAMLTLLGAPYLFQLLSISSEPAITVLAWLVLAHSSPAIFGATRLFMATSYHGSNQLKLDWMGSALFLNFIAYSSISSGLDLAKVYAVSQLASGGIGAIWVGAKLGIWPGLTALFHKQLKLI